MKQLSILFMLALLVSACGGEPPAPTMSAADVQSTAVSAAFTIVAETQAAIPTATPLPPTETASPTPPPTDTPAALPTIEVTPTTAAVSNPSGDPCATRVLSGAPKGKVTRIRIVNKTKSEVTVSIYLNETLDHNECGYRSYVVSRNGEVVINDLVQGCYNLWAFSSDSSVNGASPTSCINNSDKWTFEIMASTIKFVGP